MLILKIKLGLKITTLLRFNLKSLCILIFFKIQILKHNNLCHTDNIYSWRVWLSIKRSHLTVSKIIARQSFIYFPIFTIDMRWIKLDFCVYVSISILWMCEKLTISDWVTSVHILASGFGDIITNKTLKIYSHSPFLTISF